jgi:hypothetical protein
MSAPNDPDYREQCPRGSAEPVTTGATNSDSATGASDSDIATRRAERADRLLQLDQLLRHLPASRTRPTSTANQAREQIWPQERHVSFCAPLPHPDAMLVGDDEPQMNFARWSHSLARTAALHHGEV